MKVKELTVSAVISTAQYNNIQPSITIEVDGDVEEAKAEAMKHIVGISQQFAESGKALKGSGGKKLTAFVGGEIIYDDLTHTYTNDAGEVYLSGSQYAKQFEKPFDRDAITTAMAKKWGVNAQDIIDMWELSATASKTFGTAVHAGLELFDKYGELSTTLEKEYHIHSQLDIKNIVQSFYEAHTGEKAVCEALVVNHAAKHAGQIDRLVILGEKHGKVTDFKTNYDMPKEKLAVYWKQLQFYEDILKADGWTLEPAEIYHWNGMEWKTYVNV